MTFAERAPRQVTIAVAAPTDPAARTLVEESQAALLQHMPAEEIFSLSPEDLAVPNCHLLLARYGTEPVGCVALVDCIHYGEIKRLFVRDTCRGMGIARGLICEAELLAGEIGLRVIRLESSNALVAAAELYRSSGYSDCPAFGDYPVLEGSLFMEKRLF